MSTLWLAEDQRKENALTAHAVSVCLVTGEMKRTSKVCVVVEVLTSVTSSGLYDLAQLDNIC